MSAPVTFVVSNLDSVIRVDVTVNGRDMDALYGTFQTATTDRLTMTVPAGDSLNAFARGFDTDTVILYIGDTYFDVREESPQIVRIRLGYKGPHPVGPS